MNHDPDIENRRSIRLPGYDYSQDGAYFITICSYNRICLFGEIVNEKMTENTLGHVVSRCWNEIPAHHPYVTLDASIIMPNHVHGILFINKSASGYDQSRAKDLSPHKSHPTGTSKTLGSIVRGFKIGVTKWTRQNTKINTLWQRGFYEHIIRNDDDLNMVREYILTNPENWAKDKLHPVFGKCS